MVTILGSHSNKFNAFIIAWDSCEEVMRIYNNLATRILKEGLRLSQMGETNSALAILQISKSRTAHKGNDNSGFINRMVKNVYIAMRNVIRVRQQLAQKRK